MQKTGDSLRLSATDLIGHLNCRHLTALDLAVTNIKSVKSEALLTDTGYIDGIS